MSAAIASERPAPTAAPLIPATTGLSVSNRRARRNRPTQPFSSSACSWSESPVSTGASSPPPRSRPEQNASPLPVSATTRTSSSASASFTARTMLQPSEGVSAFFRCRRSSLNTLTCPTVSAASCDIAQGCHGPFARAHASVGHIAGRASPGAGGSGRRRLRLTRCPQRGTLPATRTWCRREGDRGGLMPSRLPAQDRQRGASSRVARRRGRAAIAALAAIALIAVSCGDDDDDSGAETGSGTEAPADQGDDQSGGAGEESVTDYVAYVGGEAGPADDSLEPINIGWLNQEGGQVEIGAAATDGADLAVQLANEQLGGIGGHPVQLKKCFIRDAEEEGTTCGQTLGN